MVRLEKSLPSIPERTKHLLQSSVSVHEFAAAAAPDTIRGGGGGN